MNRFVVHFYPANADEINYYAERNNLTIINITPMYEKGIFVLFEKGGAE